uniref:NADH dehydrogenase subunit 6 n=1 Tax=Vorticeros sp. n. MW-2019 TaxID=2544881 RepID=A0AA49XDI9_9PLAT|nr:NADH dehydrogenase subunit 6 [Vorticeros sp. n. MW-2019]
MSSGLIWVWFFFINLFASVTFNPLVICVSLLFLSLSIVWVLLINYNLWYGLVFFLIYVGAVLVLVFYLVCVNSNPINFSFSYVTVFFLLSLLVILISIENFWGFSSISYYNKVGFGLLGMSENFCVVGLFLVLLVILWMVSKFAFLSVGSIRSFV